MVSVPDVTPLPPRNGGADGVICFADRNQARNRTECEFSFTLHILPVLNGRERLLVLIEHFKKKIYISHYFSYLRFGFNR